MGLLPLILIVRFVRGLVNNLKDPEFRSLFMLVGVIILIGTVFYRQVEGWRWLDAFYFTIITLATVGYGDFTPQTDLGKIFTVIYIILGLGVLAGFITLVASKREEQAKKHLHQKEHKEEKSP